MPNNIQKILNDFLEEVKIILGNRLKKIVLYGSYARGDYNENSDIDVMILVDMQDEIINRYINQVSDCAFDYFMNYGVDISPIVKNEEHFNVWVNDLPYYNNVRNEGVKIDV